MKKILFAISLFLVLSTQVFSQSNPNFSYGQVPTPGQWDSYFSAKQDYINPGASGNVLQSNGTANYISAPLSTSSLSGTIGCSQMPALTGDVTSSLGSCASTVQSVGGKSVSLGGSFSTSGAYNFTGILTGNTTVTFPASGTLAATESPTLSNPTLTGTTTIGTVTSAVTIPMSGGSSQVEGAFFCANCGVDSSPTTPATWYTANGGGLMSTIVIPAATSGFVQADALDAIARVDSAGNYAVAISPLGQCNAAPSGSTPGGYCWGSNPQVQAVSGSKNSVMHGTEVDCENWGTGTVMTGCAQINFYPESGGTLAANATGLDLTVTPQPTTQTANNQFASGIVLEPGFAAVGIVLNPVALAASNPSMSIHFQSTNSSDATLVESIGGDSSGNLLLNPASGGNIVSATPGVALQMLGSSSNYNVLSTSNTAYRNQTLPDASGTIALTGIAQTWASGQTFVAPVLGTPASATLTNATGLPISTGVSGLGTGIATALAVNTGSTGAPVLYNGAGGTPSSMTGTNITGTASGLTAGNVTTNANLTGPITSVGNATSIASQTGTGTTFVMNTAPQISTVGIGAAVRTDSLEYIHGIPSSSGIAVQGSYSNPVGASTATSSVSAYTAAAQSAATSYTVTSLIGFLAAANVQGSGSTVTNSTGISISDQTVGSTNNYGLTSAVSSGSGKWNIYESGTANNAFEGNTAIGSTSPSSIPLTVTGAATVTGTFTASGGITATLGADTGKTDASVCLVTGTGVEYYGTGTGGLCLGTSSERFKTGIKDIDAGLSDIMSLKPKNHFYKKGTSFPVDHEYYGLMAEDVHKVLPKLVGLDEDGKPQTVDLLGIIPILVKAVQDEQKEIESLRRDLKKMHYELNSIRRCKKYCVKNNHCKK